LVKELPHKSPRLRDQILDIMRYAAAVKGSEAVQNTAQSLTSPMFSEETDPKILKEARKNLRGSVYKASFARKSRAVLLTIAQVVGVCVFLAVLMISPIAELFERYVSLISIGMIVLTVLAFVSWILSEVAERRMTVEEGPAYRLIFALTADYLGKIGCPMMKKWFSGLGAEDPSMMSSINKKRNEIIALLAREELLREETDALVSDVLTRIWKILGNTKEKRSACLREDRLLKIIEKLLKTPVFEDVGREELFERVNRVLEKSSTRMDRVPPAMIDAFFAFMGSGWFDKSNWEDCFIEFEKILDALEGKESYPGFGREFFTNLSAFSINMKGAGKNLQESDFQG